MKSIWVWLLCLIASCVILLTKLSFTYDLALFLPPPSTASQKTLIEQLGKSPGSAITLIGVREANDDLILNIRDRLRQSPEFTDVQTDLDEIDIDSIPESVWQNRLLLKDIDFSAEALSETLSARQVDMSYMGGTDFLSIMAADPQLASLDILDSISATNNSTDGWLTTDGYRILIAQTAKSAFDIEAQNRATNAIKLSIAAFAPEKDYAITGVGAFSSQLEQTISREATFRSILASIGMALVLWFAYQKFSVLALTAVPLVSGALFGLAALSIFYREIHGITLAFGFTLLGVAIDYPLHLYSHARRRSLRKSQSDISHPLITGLISTVIAYLAIMFSGAEGLAQLGLFTAVGLVGAALTTLFVLPKLGHPEPAPKVPDIDLKVGLKGRGIILIASVALAQLCYLAIADREQDSLWNNDLSSLSPVPKPSLVLDQSFRSALGTPDLRYLLTIRNEGLQAALVETESLDLVLNAATEYGHIGGWNSISSLVPSRAKQEARRSKFPDEHSLSEQLGEAVEPLAFRSNAFDPFAAQVELSRSLPEVTPNTYSGDSLEVYVDSYLYQTENTWVSVISLFEPRDLDALSAMLKESDSSAQLIDLKLASETLVADYRSRVLKLLCMAFVVVSGLLMFRTTPRRAIWCLANVGFGIGFTALTILLFTQQLDLYNLIALLLVAGLGLDYSLFLSREVTVSGYRSDILHATGACVCSTVVVFAILGTSAIPALNSLGTTVAIGSFTCFALARLGSQAKPSV